MSFKACKAAIKLGYRSLRLAAYAYIRKDYKVANIRLDQVKVCVRAFKKGLGLIPSDNG
jgi:hypothetical protein